MPSPQRAGTSALQNAERTTAGAALRARNPVGRAGTETGFATQARNPVGKQSRDAAAAGIPRVLNHLLEVDAAAPGIAGVEQPRFAITAVHAREIFLREKPECFAVN